MIATWAEIFDSLAAVRTQAAALDASDQQRIIEIGVALEGALEASPPLPGDAKECIQTALRLLQEHLRGGVRRPSGGGQVRR